MFTDLILKQTLMREAGQCPKTLWNKLLPYFDELCWNLHDQHQMLMVLSYVELCALEHNCCRGRGMVVALDMILYIHIAVKWLELSFKINGAFSRTEWMVNFPYQGSIWRYSSAMQASRSLRWCIQAPTWIRFCLVVSRGHYSCGISKPTKWSTHFLAGDIL